MSELIISVSGMRGVVGETLTPEVAVRYATAFSALAPVVFKKDKGKVQLDERDLLIKRKAMLAAYWGFWPLFVLGAMAPFFIYGPDGKVPVMYLCWMVFGGMFFVTGAQAIVTLGEYGWGNKGGKS